MKGAGLFLLCAVVVAYPDLEGSYDNGCPKDTSIDKLLPHENCDQYYQCFHGALIARYCPSGLNFNPDLERCDWHVDTKCHNKRESEINLEMSEELDNTNPNHAIFICTSGESNGVLVAHENCNEFYRCVYGKPVAVKCAHHLLYNPTNEKCDWPQNVECADRIVPITEIKNATEKKRRNSEITTSTTEENDNSYSDPSQAYSICATPKSDGILVAHSNCNRFYKCSGGRPFPLNCPNHLLYNPIKEICDWPRNVECGERTVPDVDIDDISGGGKSSESEEIDTSSEEDTGPVNNDPTQARPICAAPNSDGVLVAHEKCNQFYKCSGGHPVAVTCPGNLLYNPSKSYCDWPRNVNCSGRLSPDDTSGENDPTKGEAGNPFDPNNAPIICSSQGSDGILVAHENCNRFYKCYAGYPVELKCPGSLLYNPAKEYCDWPNYVECGDRVIPERLEEEEINNESGESSDEIVSNNYFDPREAPAICAATNSDGTLVAHENCNQFYKCSGGKPMALFCQINLFYNPRKEYCDWPNNVNCRGRIVPGDNTSSSSSEEDSSSSNADASCSSNPDGNVVAHENCSQYYKCVRGQTYPMDCPPGLYFNANLKVCDWPVNVNCGDRLTESQAFNKHGVARRALAQNAMPPTWLRLDRRFL